VVFAGDRRGLPGRLAGLFVWPEQDVVNLAYAAAALHGFGWVSLVAAQLRAGQPAAQG